MARCYYVDIDSYCNVTNITRFKTILAEEISKHAVIIPNEEGKNVLYLRKVKNQSITEKLKKTNTDIFPVICKEDERQRLVDIVTKCPYVCLTYSHMPLSEIIYFKASADAPIDQVISLVNSLTNEELSNYHVAMKKFDRAVHIAYRKYLTEVRKELLEQQKNSKSK